MIIKQTNAFSKAVKKLPKQLKAVLDEEVKLLARDLFVGISKKGDLGFLRVHKFKYLNQQYLLAYTFEEGLMVLTLLKLGVHENFYRDLKS